jgi:thiamine-phosphate diphosphorylase
VTLSLDRRPVICCVTDRTRLPDPSTSGLIDHIRAVVLAGVGLVQIRERDMADRDLTDVVRAAVEIAGGRGVPVLVNDRVDVALAAGAAGVHLKENSIPADRIRGMVPAGFVIGRSVHSAADAEAVAVAGGCDYLLFGTMYSSASKPGQAAAGAPALAEVCRRVTIPVLAIGGIDESRTAAIAAAGAAGVAAIGAFVTPSQAALDERLRAMVEEFHHGSRSQISAH